MSRPIKLASKIWRGLPYLRKEAASRLSMKTGLFMATPMIYYVIFTWRCNARCRFCTIPLLQEPRASQQLSREVMLRLLREARELSGRGFNMSLSGGEPLIYPPIYDVLKLAHELQINLGITTNGYLLSQENVKRILACDPFNVNISLESVDAPVNERMRPMPNGTSKTLKGIEYILEEKRRLGARTRVFVKPTITEANFRSLPEMVRFFGRTGEVAVNPQPVFYAPTEDSFWVQDVDGFAQVVEELVALRQGGYGLIPDAATLRGFVDYFRAGPRMDQPRASDATPPRRCSVGFRNLFIFPEGKAYLCEIVNKEIGDVNSQSLKDIWYGQEATSQRHQMLRCRVNCQSSCTRPTPLWAKVKAFLATG